METFTHYKINHTDNGIEVVLYMNENLTEFSAELGTLSKVNESSITADAINYIKSKLPLLKIKTCKIMAGGMLLSVLGVGALPTNKASAAKNDIQQSEITSLSYTVSSGDTLYSLAMRHGITVDALKQANHLSSDVLQIGQKLTIPNGVISTPNQMIYKIVSGDTLYSIATRNGTTVDAIKSVNNLSSDFLQIGQTLTIPNVSTPAPAQTADTTTHQVVSGDTLYSIAKRTGTTVDALKKANDLSSNLLEVGQELTIPKSKTSSPSPTTKNKCEVVAGDTLYSIATRNGTTVDAVKKANNLSSDLLSLGQTLTIPSMSTPITTETSFASKQQPAKNQEEVEWLAKMIFSEARGETLEGQIAVGAVIMNRVKSPLFPNTVKDVLFEKSYGYYQFTPAETGAINTATPNSQHLEAAKRAMNGEDPTNGALFFYNPDKTSSSYLRSRTVSTKIGGHVFAF
ncbi:LysM peptidoglycan-binding domain-containing protein [Bacillus sp. REN16]|uniref:LysM peptidoglycan-binding domain-containing protein n=1 Tax=Bacillus sp. REN16 TaxID=2887296 RepID=UPI001E3BEA2B|nr:LysM peptidoglycan-binding domain-containing protein [Bacillus sp. REN16]MCC3357156.1 LysM peptidoglycan-binding domain-containing protein [Bacillus sp. REN16]